MLPDALSILHVAFPSVPPQQRNAVGILQTKLRYAMYLQMYELYAEYSMSSIGVQ